MSSGLILLIIQKMPGILFYIIPGILILFLSIVIIIHNRLRKGDALIKAAISDDVKTISSLLSAGESVNYQNCDGWTALMYAALLGNENSFHFLLKHGADKNIRNSDGKTALDIVSESKCGNGTIMDYLMK